MELCCLHSGWENPVAASLTFEKFFFFVSFFFVKWDTTRSVLFEAKETLCFMFFLRTVEPTMCSIQLNYDDGIQSASQIFMINSSRSGSDNSPKWYIRANYHYNYSHIIAFIITIHASQFVIPCKLLAMRSTFRRTVTGWGRGERERETASAQDGIYRNRASGASLCAI